MDRRSFLKEMIHDLADVGKQIAGPYIEEKLDKIDRATDLITGVSWFTLGELSKGYDEQLVNGILISFFTEKEHILACSKTCLDCHELAHWISYQEELRCPECGRSYSLRNQEGTLNLKHYTVKKDTGGWQIALPAQGAAFHA